MSGQCRTNEILERIIRIETILDEHMRRTAANEKQIEEFRKFQYKMLGAITVLSPVIGYLLNHFLGK